LKFNKLSEIDSPYLWNADMQSVEMNDEMQIKGSKEPKTLFEEIIRQVG
jgi:hypothetical protein